MSRPELIRLANGTWHARCSWTDEDGPHEIVVDGLAADLALMKMVEALLDYLTEQQV